MTKKTLWVMILLLIAIWEISVVSSHSENATEEGSTRVLSRKRRYLIFPDGSSFQLVFCEQNQGYLPLSNLVWFGNTAALAWELPTDPNIFYKLIRAEKTKIYEGTRRYDTKHIVYFDEKGKVVSMIPYRKKVIVNPAFAKRSIDNPPQMNSIGKLTKEKLHELHLNINKNLFDDLDDYSASFHREGRRSLYIKLEKFLEGLGWSNGKECILRLLCENAKQEKTEQGTFMEEIMRATFTFPKKGKEDSTHREYDTALTASGICAELYPDCEE